MVHMNGLEDFDAGIEWLDKQIKSEQASRLNAPTSEDVALCDGAEHAYKRTYDYMMGIRSDIAKTVSDAQDQVLIASEVTRTTTAEKNKWLDLCEMMLESIDVSTGAFSKSGMPARAIYQNVHMLCEAWKRDLKKSRKS